MSDDTTAIAKHGLDAAQTLLAIEEIKQVRARYFETLDAKDWEAWAALFTEGRARLPRRNPTSGLLSRRYV
jgi:hypothetical protein